MEIFVAGVIVWAYFCFIFAAEQMNPFAKPDVYIRRAQWRYGRRVGAWALGFGALFLLMIQAASISVPAALLCCFSMFAVTWVLLARRSQAGDIA